MSEKKLLPCPFCGGEAQYHPWSHRIDNFFNKNTIICPTCDFAMDDVSELRLRRKWNTRKPMKRIVERLEESKGTYIDEHGKELYQEDYFIDVDDAIEIVKEEST